MTCHLAFFSLPPHFFYLVPTFSTGFSFLQLNSTYTDAMSYNNATSVLPGVPSDIDLL